VQISTLGRFAVEVGGRPLRFGQKAQKRPLTLLKVLVALGADSVHVEQLSDALWPESEGDQAYSAFSSALARLRKLIGRDALVLGDGRLTLSPTACWLDARAFEDLLSSAAQAAEAGDAESAWQHAEQSLALYRGPFLEGEYDPAEILSARERLHSLFLRHLEQLGELFVMHGQGGRAAALYRQGLEVDDLAEVLYRALMRCHQRQGRLVEAIAIYQRCRHIFRARLGSDPSRETEDLHRELVADQAHREAATLQEPQPGVPGTAPAPVAPPSPQPMPEPERPPTEPPSIAVLPFGTLADDPEQTYIADGIVEDIITELGKFRWFHVIACNTTFTYREAHPDVRRVGAELGVRYVLTGSVRRLGGRVRVTTRLAEAQAASEAWAERYDVELERLFDVQDQIVERVVGAVSPELYAAEVRRAQRRPADRLDVWTLAVRGRWHVTRLTREDNAEAQRLLERALELEPEHALASAFLAYCHLTGVLFGWSASPPQSIEEARRLAQRALSLDENDAWVHCAMGLTEFVWKQPDKAIAFYERAIELNPNFAVAHGYHALALAHAGEPERSIEAARRALRLSPRDPELIHFHVAGGTAHFVAGRYDDAAQWAGKAIAVRPEAPAGHRLLAASLAEMDRPNEARAAVAELLRLRPSMTAAAVRAAIHFKHQAHQDRYIKALLKAGLPPGPAD
jgi:TolB-like protein/DNA-binding SARP family transcriptional activator/Tfp pilus assembly protein PilF